MNKKSQGLLQLFLIFVVFAVPVAAALLWSPQRTLNHGELVIPARPIQDISLETFEQDEFRLTDFHGRWIMVYFSDGQCEKQCHDVLYKMRQVRLSQGRHANRIERLYVITDHHVPSQSFFAQYPGLRVVTGTPDNIRAFKQQFDASLPDKASLERLHIVDPLGNLMMNYPADTDPSAIRKDIGRLLKVSQVG